MKKFIPSLYMVLALSLLFTSNAQAQKSSAKHGKVSFQTSCNDQAQEKFNTGLALLHHMMYEQAEAEFNETTKIDPDCAMAYWGIAMSQIHPLWGERPSDEALAKGEKSISKANTLESQTQREQEYITAVEGFFESWEDTEYSSQLKAFEAGFEKVYNSYPDDTDAAAFYALGQLSTAPKADKTYSHQKKAGKLLEAIHQQAPEHPGVFHYIIHAYDNPELAERAVDVARGYDKIAPNVPHALHMPSHIFVRLGLWEDVIDWNKRSAEAALEQPVGDKTSLHYAHALDYLCYAYLQKAADKDAFQQLNKINTVDNFQENLAAAYGIAAMQARYPLELSDWNAAANLSTEVISFPLEKYPAAESIIHYAKGLGSANTGNLDAANEAVTKLNQLHNQLKSSGETYWATLTEAQSKSVAAWIAFSEGNRDKALELMKDAADTEDSVDKHPVTPGHVLPARELFGDMLLKMDKPDQALTAFKASLAISQNRFNSLYGAGYAAELMGDTETAKTFYSKLIEIAEKDVATRPSLNRARSFLASN